MAKTVVKIMAFDLYFSNGISMDDLYQYMILNDKKPFTVNGYTCQIISKIHHGYIFGILIANKGDKSFLTTVQDGSVLKVKKIVLAENQNSTQASIFCIEPGSKSGMFYAYHGGVSATSFGEFLRKIHDQSRRYAVKLMQQEKKKHLKDLQKQYFSGEFKLVIKFTQLDMDALLNSYQNIKSVEIAMGPAIEQSSMFRPFLSFAKGVKTVINLDGNQSPGGKINAVRDFWNSVKDKRTVLALKIAGKTLSGQDRNAQYGENVDHFGSLLLDEYINKLPGDDGDWDQFLKCEAAKDLLDIVRKNVAVIPAPILESAWKTKQNVKDINREEE